MDNKSIGFGSMLRPPAPSTKPKIEFNYTNGNSMTVYGQQNVESWIEIVETLNLSDYDYVKFEDSIVFLRHLDSVKWDKGEEPDLKTLN